MYNRRYTGKIELAVLDTAGTFCDGPCDLSHRWSLDDGRGCKAPVVPFYEALREFGIECEWATIRKPMVDIFFGDATSGKTELCGDDWLDWAKQLRADMDKRGVTATQSHAPSALFLSKDRGLIKLAAERRVEESEHKAAEKAKNAAEREAARAAKQRK